MSALQPPCGPGTTGPAVRRWWRDSMVWLVGGIIAMVVGGNAVMIWIAVQAEPHLVRTDYYEASKNVDRDQALRAASARLGWRVAAPPALLHRGAIGLRIRDAAGRPVSGLTGVVSAYRPADPGLDQPLSWQEDPATPGLYRAAFARPAAGLWRITLDLERQGARLYEELPVVTP